MVFDIWCTEPYMTPEVAYSGGPCPRKLSKSWTFVVGWQFLLAPWVLSTWFGDWLASQSPNPSWQHRVSLKHLQNTVILCHFVSLLGMLCHLGGWDNGCRHMISTTHKLPKPDNKTQCIIDKSGVGVVGQTSSKKSDVCKPHFWLGVAPYWVVSVNLSFGRIVKGRHEESEQPNCPTSWD